MSEIVLSFFFLNVGAFLFFQSFGVILNYSFFFLKQAFKLLLMLVTFNMIRMVASHIADYIHLLHLYIVCSSVQLEKPAYPKNKFLYL